MRLSQLTARVQCGPAALLRGPPAVSVDRARAQRASIKARHLSIYSWRLLAAFWMSYLTSLIWSIGFNAAMGFASLRIGRRPSSFTPLSRTGAATAHALD